MQTVSCPGCGAPVEFRSHASVMAVCSYCSTTLLKDADSVRDLGKMSAVLEDYSRLQIGSAGVFGGQNFTVLGRIQLRYEDGLWNEWYILFDDGHAGWLSDASGKHTLTVERKAPEPLPAFAELAPANAYTILGQRFIVGDVRTARCTGGQGELPFQVGPGWEARLADLHCGASFITLDYSEGELPVLYGGKAVTLEELKCQFLRDDEQIKESAGKYRGKLDALNCPSCGASVRYVPGVTQTLVCPSCRSQIDTAGSKAEVLAAGERLAAVRTTLELGAKAQIGGKAFTIIGLMRRSDDEGSEWTEYLMVSPSFGFLWLVETDEGWSRSTVLDEWPRWLEGRAAMLGERSYAPESDYTARVTFAAGAFNWRVKAGDSTRIIEFKNGATGLAAEITESEMTWSQSNVVAADQIKAWFGEKIKAEKKAAASASLMPTSYFLMAVLLTLNLIPLLFALGGTWFLVLLGLAAIYLPARFLDPGSKTDP